MEFISGLILGAILGVIADRFFTYLVEKRVYVKIRLSFPGYMGKGEYLSLNITNIGFESLPPYRIALFNPHRGTLFLFEHEKKTDRLPGQTDEFSISINYLRSNGMPFLSWFTHSVPKKDFVTNPNEIKLYEMKPEEFQKWVLRLVIEDGEDKILYENNRAGVALAEIIRNTMQTGHLNPTWEQIRNVYITTNPWVRWKEWRQRRKELRDLEVPMD
jgi:hypothetical protein